MIYILFGFILGSFFSILAAKHISFNEHPNTSPPIIYAEVDESFQITKLSSLIYFEGEWIPHGEVYEFDFHNNEIQYVYYKFGEIKSAHKLGLSSGLKDQPISLIIPPLEERKLHFRGGGSEVPRDWQWKK